MWQDLYLQSVIIIIECRYLEPFMTAETDIFQALWCPSPYVPSPLLFLGWTLPIIELLKLSSKYTTGWVQSKGCWLDLMCLMEAVNDRSQDLTSWCLKKKSHSWVVCFHGDSLPCSSVHCRGTVKVQAKVSKSTALNKLSFLWLASDITLSQHWTDPWCNESTPALLCLQTQ